MAAVLAAGASAVLSHRPAGALWGVIRWAGETDVTVPGRRASRDGLRVHESKIAPGERCIEDGIPVTTISRTLLDLASMLDRDRLHQAVAKAEKLGLTDPVGLPALLERHRGRRGIAALREIVADRRLGLDVARSELEVDFRAFLRRRDLPPAEVNAWIEVGGKWLEVDFLWRHERVVVELDSRAHHADWDAAEADRARDRTLIANGVIPIRVTWRALHLEPERLYAELRAALAGRAATSLR
jgi:very-short-patch-repair endonuclease